MSNFFKDLINEIKDEDTTLASDGRGSAEYTGCIDTGSYILNAVLSGSLYGGVPNNKITAFAGESATGKTFFVLGVVRAFLDANPTGGVVYYDTEAAVTREMMEERGIDTTRVIISEPATIQQFRHHALKLIEAYDKQDKKKRPPMMFVLDSLGLLSSTKELEDTAEGKDTRDMTKAQLIKACFRVLTLKLARVKIPLIITNHVYAAIGAYVPTNEIAGGSGLKYAASTICMLSKKKDKEGTDVVGNIVRIKMYKSRLSKENSQVEVKLSYATGLDRYYGLLELAEKYNIIKKVSTRYELPDGTKVFGKNINEEPEKYFTPDVLAQLEVAAKKEFSYGGKSPELMDAEAEAPVEVETMDEDESV
jgi:RecA/RadA recombinase